VRQPRNMNKKQEAEAEAAKAAAEAAPEATETRQSAQEESAGGNTEVSQLRMKQLSELDPSEPNFEADLKRAGVIMPRLTGSHALGRD